MLPHNFHIIHFYISFLNLSCRGNVIYLINVLQLKVSTLYSNKKKKKKNCMLNRILFLYLPSSPGILKSSGSSWASRQVAGTQPWASSELTNHQPEGKQWHNTCNEYRSTVTVVKDNHGVLMVCLSIGNEFILKAKSVFKLVCHLI